MSTCPQATSVKGHFAGALSPRAERALRTHLPECATCRRLYDRHLVLAQMDPDAKTPAERLRRGLGFSSPRTLWTSGLTISTVLAATLLFLLLRPSATLFREPQARGGSQVATAWATAATRLHVYARSAKGPASDLGKDLGAEHELFFAYENPAGRPYLMVFGEDETGTIYWYVPAWTDGSTNPRALRLEASPEPREVGYSVRHKVTGKRLTLHALFLDQDQSVRQVEAALHQNQRSTLTGSPHLTWELRIRP